MGLRRLSKTPPKEVLFEPLPRLYGIKTFQRVQTSLPRIGSNLFPDFMGLRHIRVDGTLVLVRSNTFPDFMGLRQLSISNRFLS